MHPAAVRVLTLPLELLLNGRLLRHRQPLLVRGLCHEDPLPVLGLEGGCLARRFVRGRVEILFDGCMKVGDDARATGTANILGAGTRTLPQLCIPLAVVSRVRHVTVASHHLLRHEHIQLRPTLNLMPQLLRVVVSAHHLHLRLLEPHLFILRIRRLHHRRIVPVVQRLQALHSHVRLSGDAFGAFVLSETQLVGGLSSLGLRRHVIH